MPSDWIACSDRQPDIDYEDSLLCRSREVLLFSQEIGIMVGYLQDSSFGLEDGADLQWKLAGRDTYDAGTVTHWMPLPEVPHA